MIAYPMMKNCRTLAQFLCFALLACLHLAFVCSASPQVFSAEEKSWLQSFLQWARPLAPENFPGKIEQMYRQQLASQGLKPAEIEQRWSSILKQRNDNEEWGTLALDKRYAGGWYQGEPPSRFLVEFAKGKAVGKVLDCGMGAGRNAVFLASLGWDVTGVDISEVAIERARGLAATAGVKIHAIRSSYRDFDWGKNQWDLIINIDSWDGEGKAPSTFAAAPLREAIKPGGLLYIESHLPALTSPEKILTKTFPGLNILKHEFGGDPSWQGRSKDMVIFVAQRPVDPRP